MLRARAEGNERLTEIVEKLDLWRNEAAFKPVFEFYAGVLARDGIRSAMIARLGPAAGEILDEFLSFCLEVECTDLPGLESFLARLESAGPDIKSEMDQVRDEVRIMTVHSAKGAGGAGRLSGGRRRPALFGLPSAAPHSLCSAKWRLGGQGVSVAGIVGPRQPRVACGQRGADRSQRLTSLGIGEPT